MSASHEFTKSGPVDAACEENATLSSAPASPSSATPSSTAPGASSTHSSAPASAAPSSDAVHASERAGEPDAPEAPAQPSFAHASHAALFAEPEADLCDVCGAPVREDEEEDADEGYAIPGRGMYVWSRGEERRLEEPPLCAACAAAVGVSAMARWEIEEEEG